jgi:hypothetical protein
MAVKFRIALGALAAAAFSTSATPAFADMDFRVVMTAGGARVIAAEGQIGRSTPETLRAFLRANIQRGVRAVVYMHSPGGSVRGSMELGESFRRLGVAVVVARVAGGDESRPGRTTAGGCFSACVYALMGGAKRVVPPQSLVGVHKMFAMRAGGDPSGDSGGRDFDDGRVASGLARYAARMGVSRELISRAERSSPDAIYMLNQTEIRRWRLAVPAL